MAINIIDTPEPLSDATRRTLGLRTEPLLVESAASRVLRQELQRYCKGLINGRSFLIAGHRGAGKTTLVAKAFMDVWRDADDGKPLLRPLFIPLHGPSLFPGPAPASEPDARKADGDVAKSDAQIALEQITLGLHRAVSREFAERYRERADQLAELRRRPARALADLRATRASRTAPEDPLARADAVFDDGVPDEAELHRLIGALPHERELFELAAQFEAELYEGPTPQRLREFWARMQALSGGVLFRDGYAPLASGLAGYPTPPTPGGMHPNLIEVHAQGARELVALAGVLEAYRRISGEYRRSEGGKDTQQQTRERTVGLNAATKELVAPVASLLTGGLAGTAFAISGATPLLTAAGGVVTALGASLVFKATTTSQRERSLTREYHFIYDLSVATLDRILPILIQRLRVAGLAPVFVVDELDKVKELSARIITMVHHLKKLVAENAFFCFLTNRSYFEEMLAEAGDRPYPVEYTYYTHRMFVVFAPEDFERYLRARIPDPAAAPADAPADDAQLAQNTIEATACAILRWALRHRSQLHVVDLQREIAALRDDAGAVRTAPELIASARRNRIDMTFQVAIELTLGQPEVDQVLMDRPDFRRTVHDAMYYLSRKWLEGADEVDVSDDCRIALRDYLESRTGRDEERSTILAQAGENAAGGAELAPKPSVRDRDLDFLLDQVGILADFLSDRPRRDPADPTRDWREERLDAWNTERVKRGLPPVEPDVADALLVGERSSVLIRDPARPGLVRFRHRLTGTARPARALPGARGPQPPAPTPPTKRPPEPLAPDSPAAERAEAVTAPPSEWLIQARFIEEFARGVQRLARQPADATGPQHVTLDTLGSRFRILPPTPSASVALQAIARLRDAATRGTTHAAHDDDVFIVQQLYELLLRNGEVIARAIALAAVIGRASTEADEGVRIATGLGVMARAMKFASRREGDVAHAIENVAAMVRALHGLDLLPPPAAEPLSSEGVIRFLDVANDAIEGLESRPPHESEPLLSAAWQSMHTRLAHWVRRGDVLEPDLFEMFAAARRIGPALVLEFDPAEMTLQQWTRALLAARYSPGDEVTPPIWLTFFAWHALGFRANGDWHVQQFAQWAGLGAEFALANAAQAEHYEELLRRTHRLVHERTLLLGQTPDATLVMLRRRNSPLTAQWRPVPDTAVLLLHAGELQDLALAGGAYMELPLTSDRVAAVEMEPELAAQLYTTQLPALRGMLQSGWLIYVYPNDRGRDMKLPHVLAPATAAAVITAGIDGRTNIPLPD